MKYLVIISTSIIFFFTSCEDQELLAPEIEYEELTVVQCEFSPNQFFPGVRLTRTLPLGVKYDIKLAEIEDATLYIRINGIKIVPLHYTSDGLYNTLYDLILNEGEYLELFGEREGKTFYARSKVPFIPQISTVSFISSGQYGEAAVKFFNDEVYSAIWAVSSGSMISPDDFFNISSPPENTYAEFVKVRSASFPVEYQSSVYNGRRNLRIFSFDSSFKEYFNTKGEGGQVDNPYVQASENTIWNVKGTDIIGMFIGTARSDFISID